MQWLFFNPDFLLKFLILKIKLQKLRKNALDGILGGFLGYFGGIVLVFGKYSKFLIFLNFKK
jgi:hypothetical protein